MKVVLRRAIIIILLLILAGLLALLWISVRPLPLGFLINANENKLDIEGHRLEYSNLALFFDSGFGVSAKGVNFLAKDAPQPMVLDELEVRLRTAALLHGQVLPEIIIARGLKLDAALNREKATIGGIVINSSKGQDTPATDFIALLNNVDQNSALTNYLNALQEFRVEKAQILFHDQIEAQDWQADKLRVHLEKKAQGGFEFTIKLALQRGLDHVPVEFGFTHEKGAPSAAMHAKIAVPNLKMLAGYVPAGLADALTSPIILKVSTVLGEGNTFSAPAFRVTCSQGILHLPTVFSSDLDFAAIDLNGAYDFSAAGSLTIDSVRFQDRLGFEITAAGKLSSLRANPFLDASINLSPTTIDHIAHYLPDAAASQLSHWLSSNLNLATVRLARMEMSGPLADFPFPEDKPGTKFHAAFEFDNLEVVYQNAFQPGRELAGTFEMNRGLISIRSPAGKIGGQQVSNLLVTIGDVMKHGEAPVLSVSGEAAGDASDALATFVQPLAKNSRLPELQGKQTAQVKLSIPLAGKSGGLVFSVLSNIRQARVHIPDTPFTFESELLTVNSTDKETTITSDGLLNNRPTSLSIRETTSSFGENTAISLKTEINKEFCEAYIPKGYLQLDGTAKSTLALQKRSGRDDSYAYELSIDFLQAGTSVPALKWGKAAGAPASFSATGVLFLDKKALDVGKLSLTAPQMNIGASGRVLVDKPELSEITVSPLIIGGTDLSLRYSAGKTVMTGRRLDYKALAMKQEDAAGKPLPDLDVALNIDEVTLNQGLLRKITGGAKSAGGAWKALDFRAKTPGQGDARIYLDAQGFKASSSDAGALLKVLSLSSDLRGGNFEGNMSPSPGKKLDLKDAHGSFTITNVRILKSPLLFKILSFFSLEKWLSSEEGAVFQEIGASYNIKGSIFEIEESHLTSPLLTIYLSGTLDMLKNDMNLKGKAVPLRSAGTLTENIPLLGKGISAVQRRLLGANFTVKGPTGNPDVSFLTLPF
jgi:hypothetical protein